MINKLVKIQIVLFFDKNIQNFEELASNIKTKQNEIFDGESTLIPEQAIIRSRDAFTYIHFYKNRADITFEPQECTDYTDQECVDFKNKLDTILPAIYEYLTDNNMLVNRTANISYYTIIVDDPDLYTSKLLLKPQFEHSKEVYIRFNNKILNKNGFNINDISDFKTGDLKDKITNITNKAILIMKDVNTVTDSKNNFNESKIKQFYALSVNDYSSWSKIVDIFNIS